MTAKAFATLDTLSGGRVILGIGAGHVERSSTRSGSASPTAGSSPTMRHRRHRSRHGRASSSERRHVGRHDAAPRAAAPATDLDRRLDEARRCGGSRRGATAGSRRARPSSSCPSRSRTCSEHRDEVRPGAEPEIGMITECIYLGDADWDVPQGTRHRLARAGRRVAQRVRRDGRVAPAGALPVALDRRAVRPDGAVRRPRSARSSRARSRPPARRGDTTCRCSRCATTSGRPIGGPPRTPSCTPRASSSATGPTSAASTSSSSPSTTASTTATCPRPSPWRRRSPAARSGS